jgi:hypothetical protein
MRKETENVLICVETKKNVREISYMRKIEDKFENLKKMFLVNKWKERKQNLKT